MTQFLFLLLLAVSISAFSQEKTLPKPGRVIFYNVENLFDTIDDPETKDDDFLQQGKNH